MILYGVRNKATGELVEFNFMPVVSRTKPVVYDGYVCITFREVPTEPCPRCTEPVDFYDYGNTFCGDCGRRLTDETA